MFGLLTDEDVARAARYSPAKMRRHGHFAIRNGDDTGLRPHPLLVQSGELGGNSGARQLHAEHAPSDPRFDVQMNITDQNGGATLGTVQVWIEDVPEPPSWNRTTLTIAEFEGDASSFTEQRFPAGLLALDQDAADKDKLTFSWIANTGASAPISSNPVSADGNFRIDTGTGDVTILNSAAFSAPGTYNLAAAVEDTQGHRETTDVTLVITDQNAQPVFTGGNEQRVLVSEDAGDDFLITTMECTDEDTAQNGQVVTLRIEDYSPASASWRFVLNRQTGQLRTTDLGTLMDHEDEAESYFRLVVSCRDNGPGELQAQAVLHINITDAPEDPFLPESDDQQIIRKIREDAPVGTLLKPINGTDDDESDNLVGLKWSLVDIATFGSIPFEMTPSEGSMSSQIRLTEALDFETKSSYMDLRLTVEDGTGRTYSTGFAGGNIIVIEVIDVNEPPQSQDASVSIDEGAVQGSQVVFVPASDPDIGTTLEYTIIGGDPNGVFSAGPASKQIAGRRVDGFEVLLAGAVDYEQQGSFDLLVDISDGELNVTQHVLVEVIDQNDIQIDSVTATASPTTGGSTVRFSGRGMGAVWRQAGQQVEVLASYSQATLAGAPVYQAANCRVVQAPTDVECETVPGYGEELEWTLTVNNHTVVVDRSELRTSYVAPTVTRVEGASDMSTDGDSTFRVTGTNFGPSLTPVRVVYRPADALAASTEEGVAISMSGRRCAVLIAHTEIICSAAPGVGSMLEFDVFVGTQGMDSPFGSSTANGVFGYESPVITEVTTIVNARAAAALASAGSTEMEMLEAIEAIQSLDQDNDRLSTHGVDIVVLEGTSFGPGHRTLPGSAVRACYGPEDEPRRYCTVCRGHTRLSHEKVYCPVHEGVGGGHAWRATVGGQESPASTSLTSYRTPELVAVAGPGI